jgi:hypothetical protein
MQKRSCLELRGEGGENGRAGQGEEMTQTMYALVKKILVNWHHQSKGFWFVSLYLEMYNIPQNNTKNNLYNLSYLMLFTL